MKPREYPDLTGRFFGNLEVLRLLRTHPKYGRIWLCACKARRDDGTVCTNLPEVSTGKLQQTLNPTRACKECSDAANRKNRAKHHPLNHLKAFKHRAGG